VRVQIGMYLGALNRARMLEHRIQHLIEMPKTCWNIVSNITNMNIFFRNNVANPNTQHYYIIYLIPINNKWSCFTILKGQHPLYFFQFGTSVILRVIIARNWKRSSRQKQHQRVVRKHVGRWVTCGRWRQKVHLTREIRTCTLLGFSCDLSSKYIMFYSSYLALNRKHSILKTRHKHCSLSCWITDSRWATCSMVLVRHHSWNKILQPLVCCCRAYPLWS